MTREEAKRNLIHAIRWNDMPKKEALDMAIKVLEEEPITDVDSNVLHKISEFFSNWDGDENAKMEISVEDMREISSMFVTKCRVESKLKALEQEPQTFEWCTNCREYDQEKHCCHRWSKVIRDTVEEMKQQPCEDDTISREDAYSEVKE